MQVCLPGLQFVSCRRLLVFPKGNSHPHSQVSAYLDCGEHNPDNWTRRAKFKLSVVNQCNETKTICKCLLSAQHAYPASFCILHSGHFLALSWPSIDTIDGPASKLLALKFSSQSTARSKTRHHWLSFIPDCISPRVPLSLTMFAANCM